MSNTCIKKQQLSFLLIILLELLCHPSESWDPVVFKFPDSSFRWNDTTSSHYFCYSFLSYVILHSSIFKKYAMNKQIFKIAYELDEVLAPFEKNHNAQNLDNKILHNELLAIREQLKPIKPKKDFFYGIWRFWLKLPCGSFADPKPAKWYRLSCYVGRGGKEFYVSFANYFLMLTEKNILRGYQHSFEQQYQILDFIQQQLTPTITAILKDPAGYYDNLEKELPKRHRFGRIKRNNLWEHLENITRQDKELGPNAIKKLTEILPQLTQGKLLTNITANDFFNYCAIGYDANDYDLDTKLKPVEKYKRMADMRDENLTEINGDSSKAFYEWYHHRLHKGGGHPWEICRGDNSTHISLQVSSEKKNLWLLWLAGSNRTRIVETVKIALALYEHDITVKLCDAEAILHMVTGTDNIGLVPHDITPKSCGGFFPDKDKITDFMNIWQEPENFAKIKDYICWYPLERWG
jgi:hypothetical protein